MYKQKQKQKEGRLSRHVLLSAMIAGIAVAVVFTVTPWNFIPTEVTEDVTVIANTGYGCVGESQYGLNVVVCQQKDRSKNCNCRYCSTRLF